MLKLDLSRVATPCFVCDLGVLRRNLSVLDDVQRRSGCKILLALKGFAMWSVFPLLRRHLHGVAASSVDEARLGIEEFGREVHVYAPAYSELGFREVLAYADHIVFNSLSQWRRLRPLLARIERPIQCGIRINPEHSEVAVALYDPCAPGSRLGVIQAALQNADLTGISGLHFHVLCQSGADALERTLAQVEQKFGAFLGQVQWVNFGGGHHITRSGYDVERLVRLIRSFSDRYGVQVYLEPGEAVALHAGYLVVSVLDIIEHGVPIAMLDTSASAHMPDVLEMPYRPQILGAGEPGEHPHQYRLGGLTCLAGDVIGDYSFREPLEIGDRLVLTDMAHYTMVKSTTFNGVRLPSIASYDPDDDELCVVRRFAYEDYRSRLS
jgi:carboxynorspermidine decarboxylase